MKKPVIKFELKNKYKMGKKNRHFRKTNPKHSSDEETPDAEDRLSRDLKSGAAFIHPDRRLRRSPNRRILVQETPDQQNQTVSSSADSTAVVEESYYADESSNWDLDRAQTESPKLFWDPQARKMVKSHVPKLLAKMGLKDVTPTTNAGDPVPSTSNQTPNVELLRDVIQLPTHPEFRLFNLRKNFPNSPIFRGYTPERLSGNPPDVLKMSFREPVEESEEDPAEESFENLNEALENENQVQLS